MINASCLVTMKSNLPVCDNDRLYAKLNAVCYLLALLGAHPILHISRIRVKLCYTLLIHYSLVLSKHVFHLFWGWHFLEFVYKRLPLCTPWRYGGGGGGKGMAPLIVNEFCHWRAVNIQLHAPATLPTVPTEQEAEWAPKPVCTLENRKLSCSCWELNMNDPQSIT
jgi:hypothetical protein